MLKRNIQDTDGDWVLSIVVNTGTCEVVGIHHFVSFASINKTTIHMLLV